MLKYTEVAAFRHNPTPRLTWCIQKCLHERRITLTEHIPRGENCDPMRQVSFRRDSAAPYTPIFTRPRRPRKTWPVTYLEFCWTKNHRIPYSNANEQQQQQILLDARKSSLLALFMPLSMQWPWLSFAIYHLLAWWFIPVFKFCLSCWCSWLLLPCFT